MDRSEDDLSLGPEIIYKHLLGVMSVVRLSWLKCVSAKTGRGHQRRKRVMSREFSAIYREKITLRWTDIAFVVTPILIAMAIVLMVSVGNFNRRYYLLVIPFALCATISLLMTA